MRYHINLFFLLTVLTTDAIAQPDITNYQSFAIDNKEVVWMQVYHQEDSAINLSQKIAEHLSRKAWINNLHTEGEDLLADVVNYRPDYKRYGGKYLNTSTVIRTGHWTGKARISFRAGKYRVVLYALNYTARQATSGPGKATIEQHNISGSLSEWALHDFRTSFRKTRLPNLDILHLSFKDSFTLMTDQLIDSDW